MGPVTRDLVEFVDPEDVEPRRLALPAPFGVVDGRPLAGSATAGDGAVLVELPAGWTGGGAAGPAPFAFELIALDGELSAGGVALRRHGYVAVPASEDGWTASGGLVPGPPPGLARKPIRGQFGVPCGFFIRVPAGWHEERTEWHDSAEACIYLDGDLVNHYLHVDGPPPGSSA